MEVNEQENQPAVATPATEKESSPSKENVTPKAEKGWFSSLKNLRKSKSLTPVDFQKGGTLPPSSPPTSPSKFSARSTIDGVPSQDTEGSNNNSVNKSESEDTITDSSTSYNFEPSKQESTSSDIKAEGSDGAHDSKKSTNDEAASSSASTPSVTRNASQEQTGIITDLLCQIKELSMTRATDTDLIGELRTDLAEAKKQMQVHVVKNAALNTELEDLKEKITLLELNNKYFTHFYDLKSMPGSLQITQVDVNKVVTPQEEILQRFAQPFAITKLVKEQEQLLEKKEQQIQQLLQQLEVQRTNTEFQKQLDGLPLPSSHSSFNLSEALSSSSSNLLALLQTTPPTTPMNTTIGSNPFSEMVDETKQQKVNQEEFVKHLKREIFIRDEEIRRLKETIVPQIQQLKNQLKLKNSENSNANAQHQHTQTHDFKPNRSVSEDDFKLRHEFHMQQQQIEQQQQTILDLKLKLKDLQSDSDGSGLSSNQDLEATNQQLQNSLKDHLATIDSLKSQLKKSVEQQLHSHQHQQQTEQKCKQLEAELENLRSTAIKQGSSDEVVSLRAEIEQQSHKLKVLQHEVASLQQENAAQRKQINDLNTHNQQLLQEMEKQRTHHEKALDDLTKEAKKYEAQWLEKQQQLAEANQSAEELKATLQKEHSKIEVKELELKELKAKLLQVQEEVAKLQSDIQHKEEQHKTVVNKYEEKMKQNAEHTEDMQKQLEELRAEYRNNLNENSKLQETSSHQQQKIDQLQATITVQKTELEQLQTKKVELLSQLENAQAGVATAKSENDSLKQDLEQATTENSQLKFTIEQFKEIVASLRATFKTKLDQMRAQIKEQRSVVLECHNKYIEYAVDSVKQIQQTYDALTQEAKESIVRYKLEVEKRRKLHNIIEDMKGKIRVYCRVRPLTQYEECSAFRSCIDFPQADQMILTQYTSSGKEEKKQFDFERVFMPQENQVKVFSEVKDLVTSVMDGYNVCIFAYGQTGSGKTYTMEGPDTDPGINFRALDELFKIAEERKKDYEYKITVSMIEIYNEALRDLLSENSLGLDLRQDENGGVYVPNLAEKSVTGYNEVLQLLNIGKKNRSVASTGMNDQSSRSHMILKVNVKGRNVISDTVTNASLSLIDLAGSERLSRSGAMQQQMTEAQHINKSLSNLGDVISALKNKQTHIPYRNSKLTHFLQDSLSGESKVLMIVQISPCRADASESVCSLNFATRVNSVTVQTPKTPKKEQAKEQKPPTPLSSPRKRDKS